MLPSFELLGCFAHIAQFAGLKLGLRLNGLIIVEFFWKILLKTIKHLIYAEHKRYRGNFLNTPASLSHLPSFLITH